MIIGGILKHYCEYCGTKLNHKITALEKRDQYEYNASDFYMIVECMGCTSLSYRTQKEDYEEWDYDDSGHQVPTTSIERYPNVLAKHQIPENLHVVPERINTIYHECIKSFAAECLILTAAGFRALIEEVCKDRGIRGDDLSKKINKLRDNRFISPSEATRLHSIRFLGNDSIHELAVPTKIALNTVLKIIDNLLTNMYILEYEAKRDLITAVTDIRSLLKVIDLNIRQLIIGNSYTLKGLMGTDLRLITEDVKAYDRLLQNAITEGKFPKLKFHFVPKDDNPNEQTTYYTIVSNKSDDF